MHCQWNRQARIEEKPNSPVSMYRLPMGAVGVRPSVRVSSAEWEREGAARRGLRATRQAHDETWGIGVREQWEVRTVDRSK